MAFRIYALEPRVWDLGLGFRAWALGFSVEGLGLGVVSCTPPKLAWNFIATSQNNICLIEPLFMYDRGVAKHGQLQRPPRAAIRQRVLKHNF